MKVVIILPTYNERENIILLLNGLRQSLKNITHHEFAYLIVDDNSPDGTTQLVRSYGKRYPEVSVVTGKKEGLGKALLRGMTYAVTRLDADCMLQMDADLSHDPAAVPAFIEALDGGASFVVGSRYIPGGSIPDNWGLHRKLFSRVGNAIVRFGLGHPEIHDWTGGFRAYRKIYYEKLKDQVTGYGGYVFQIAYLHKAVLMGAKIKEVPIHFTDRRFGHSKIAPAEYIKNVLVYVLLNGSFGKFLIVGGIGFILNAVLLVFCHDILGWPATVSNLTGAAVAIFSNFNLNNIWTFKHEKISGIGTYLTKLVQFYLTSAFGVVVIQTGTIWLGVSAFGDRVYFLSFLVGTALLLVWNYTMYSKVIWRKSK